MINEIQLQRDFFFNINFFWSGIRNDKHVIVQIFAFLRENIRACLVLPWVFWLDLHSRLNTDHGSTKLTLIFSQIEQKTARLHETIPLSPDFCQNLPIFGTVRKLRFRLCNQRLIWVIIVEMGNKSQFCSKIKCYW